MRVPAPRDPHEIAFRHGKITRIDALLREEHSGGLLGTSGGGQTMHSGKASAEDDSESKMRNCHHTRMFEMVREPDGRKVFRCSECGAQLDTYTSISDP
jgi:hypothetical protein